jgi:hypothetical protein
MISEIQCSLLIRSLGLTSHYSLYIIGLLLVRALHGSIDAAQQLNSDDFDSDLAGHGWMMRPPLHCSATCMTLLHSTLCTSYLYKKYNIII